LRAAPALAGIVIVVSVGLASLTTVPLLAALAFLPTGVTTIAIGLMGVHPRRLRMIGWSMVGANVLTVVLLLAA
jgi:hypothetical protein